MRVNRVSKCRKSPGKCHKCGCAIKVGDPYRWFQFAFSPKSVRCSKSECAPTRSDLTRSGFYQSLFGIEDTFNAACGEARSSTDPTIAIQAARDAADELRNLGSECEEKRSNMPESLQDSSSGQLLEERQNECEDKASEFESYADTAETDWENRNEDKEDGEEKGEQETCDSIIDELESNADFSIS